MWKHGELRSVQFPVACASEAKEGKIQKAFCACIGGLLNYFKDLCSAVQSKCVFWLSISVKKKWVENCAVKNLRGTVQLLTWLQS